MNKWRRVTENKRGPAKAERGRGGGKERKGSGVERAKTLWGSNSRDGGGSGFLKGGGEGARSTPQHVHD